MILEFTSEAKFRTCNHIKFIGLPLNNNIECYRFLDKVTSQALVDNNFYKLLFSDMLLRRAHMCMCVCIYIYTCMYICTCMSLVYCKYSYTMTTVLFGLTSYRYDILLISFRTLGLLDYLTSKPSNRLS